MTGIEFKGSLELIGINDNAWMAMFLQPQHQLPTGAIIDTEQAQTNLLDAAKKALRSELPNPPNLLRSGTILYRKIWEQYPDPSLTVTSPLNNVMNKPTASAYFSRNPNRKKAQWKVIDVVTYDESHNPTGIEAGSETQLDDPSLQFGLTNRTIYDLTKEDSIGLVLPRTGYWIYPEFLPQWGLLSDAQKGVLNQTFHLLSYPLN